MEEIQELLQGDEMPLVEVDYNNSAIKGQYFLNYIANLELNVDIDMSTIPCAEVQELLSQYLYTDQTVNIPSLNSHFASMLLRLKGLEVEGVEEFTEAFMEKHSKQVKEIIRFLDSLLFTIPFVSDDYKASIGKELIESNEIETINDEEIGLGINVIRVLEIEDFVPLYYQLPITTRPAYYKRQLEGQFYAGNSLFNYLRKTDNILMVLFTGISEQWFSSGDFLKAVGA